MQIKRLRVCSGPVYRNIYNDSVEYRHNDIVKFDGLKYAHTGETDTTGVPPSNADVWSRYINDMLVEDFLENAMSKAAKEGIGIRMVKHDGRTTSAGSSTE